MIEIYASPLKHGVQIWIDGGWGVGALLERQTRSHKDLDAIVAFDELLAMTAVLSANLDASMFVQWAREDISSFPKHLR